jgi:hypothetical protein
VLWGRLRTYGSSASFAANIVFDARPIGATQVGTRFTYVQSDSAKLSDLDPKLAQIFIRFHCKVICSGTITGIWQRCASLRTCRATTALSVRFQPLLATLHYSGIPRTERKFRHRRVASIPGIPGGRCMHSKTPGVTSNKGTERDCSFHCFRPTSCYARREYLQTLQLIVRRLTYHMSMQRCSGALR